MSSLDSVAVFQTRMVQLGLGNLINEFENLGWTTLGNFAFAGPGGPNGGPADEALFQEGIVAPLFGGERDPRIAALRRLQFEAYTTCVGDLQRRANRSDEDDKPKVMPGPERAVRLAEIKMAVPGIDVEDFDLEPSDTLIHKLAYMQETTGVLKYLPFEDIGRRDFELVGIKKDFKFLTNGS